MPYGVANRNGQVTVTEAAAIVACARSAGIDMLDTAVSYGDSEQRLGDIGVGDWRVITKVPPIPESTRDVGRRVQAAVTQSLRRLRVPRLHAVLVHRPDQLQGERGEALYRALLELRDGGRTDKIGVSVYDPADLDALDSRFAFDLVQAPFNVIDRRLATTGWLGRLRRRGVDVHARSVFLQGLLLMNAATRPAQFAPWDALFARWDRWLTDRGLTPVQACLGFVLAHAEFDRVVVGVDSATQLQEVLAAAVPAPFEYPPDLTCEDPRLVTPSRWEAR